MWENNTWGDTSLSEFPRDINWDDTNIFVFFEASFLIEEASQVAQWFKKKKQKTPANAGGARDIGSSPGSERFPGIKNGNPLHYSSWKLPWTEEPGGLQSMGLQRVRHDWVTEHTHTSSRDGHQLQPYWYCRILLSFLKPAGRIWISDGLTELNGTDHNISICNLEHSQSVWAGPSNLKLGESHVRV